MSTLVKNANGTSRWPEPSTKDGSWLEYREKATGLKNPFCKRVDCLNSELAFAVDGSHVQLDTPSDRRWWITPLCHKCNTQFGAHFTVKGPLVSVTDPKVILW